MKVLDIPDDALLEMDPDTVAAAPNVTDDMGSIDRFLTGIGRGMHNIGRTALGWTPESMGIQNAMGNDVEMDRLDAPLLDTTAGMLGNLAGEIVTTAPIGGGAASLLGRGGAALMPQMAARTGAISQGIGRGVIEGGIEASLVGGDAGTGAGVGGVIGGAIPGVGRLWRGAARPARPSREALEIERLGRQQDVDINLTAGQLADPDANFTGGLIKGVENTIDRVPGAGAVLNAKEAAMSNWNIAELRNALPEDLAGQITAAGPDGMAQVRRTIGDAYDEALGNIQQGDIVLDDDALNGLIDLGQTAINRVGPDDLPGVQSDLVNLVNDLSRGRLDGANIKQLESDLGTKIQQAANIGNGDVADAYRGMLASLRQARDAFVGPEGAARLQELDASYRRLIPLREAAAMKGSVSQGYFTPSQMLTGGQKGQSPWGKATARDPMSRRALDADNVFGSTIPNMGPGTAEKMAMQSLLGGAGSVAADMASGGSGGLIQSGLIGAATAPAIGQLMPHLRDPLMGRTAGQAWMRRMQHPLDNILEEITPWAIRSGVLGNAQER